MASKDAFPTLDEEVVYASCVEGGLAIVVRIRNGKGGDAMGAFNLGECVAPMVV